MRRHMDAGFRGRTAGTPPTLNRLGRQRSSADGVRHPGVNASGAARE
jgi:hypothetical protein